MLIRGAQIVPGERADVRIEGSRVHMIAPQLAPTPGEEVVEAQGGALLPGLHDHHLHLRALAAAQNSLRCGPPQVEGEAALAAALRAEDRDSDRDGDWLRGIGYYESVAGAIDRAWLDRHISSRPTRIQHRSGRLWILNSAGLDWLTERGAFTGADPFERVGGRLTGRLYDADDWLRRALASAPPSLAAVSARLARYGITGVTDTTPRNGCDTLAEFARARGRGELRQACLLMGDASLDGIAGAGPRKFHLHEGQWPELDDVVAQIGRSHAAGRNCAFHCVTRAELVFVLAALTEAGARRGDRIEHAGVAPPELVAQIATLGLTVVTQPNFIAERGDAYLRDVDPDDRPWLYRLKGFLDAGVPLAAGSDAPFGDPNPWLAMHAAVTRRTASGQVMGEGEQLRPELALALFLAPLDSPGSPARSVEPGVEADLCLLDRPWACVRDALAAVRVRLTLKGGEIVWRGATQS